jgi:hypothetical protein
VLEYVLIHISLHLNHLDFVSSNTHLLCYMKKDWLIITNIYQFQVSVINRIKELQICNIRYFSGPFTLATFAVTSVSLNSAFHGCEGVKQLHMFKRGNVYLTWKWGWSLSLLVQHELRCLCLSRGQYIVKNKTCKWYSFIPLVVRFNYFRLMVFVMIFLDLFL